jgi:antitoxin PrlF
MASLQTKLTSQSQVSVPAPIRNAMGLKPSSVIEWNIQGEQIIVTRVVKWSSEDIHQALFAETPKLSSQVKSLAQLKEGIKASLKKRHVKPA